MLLEEREGREMRFVTPNVVTVLPHEESSQDPLPASRVSQCVITASARVSGTVGSASGLRSPTDISTSFDCQSFLVASGRALPDMP